MEIVDDALCPYSGRSCERFLAKHRVLPSLGHDLLLSRGITTWN